MSNSAGWNRTVSGKSDSTSSSLLERVQAREGRAWQRLVQLCVPIVYRWARQAGLEPSAAGEMVEEVFRTVAAHVGQFRRDRPEESFRAWLWSITRSRLNDYFREHSGQPLSAAGVEAATECSDVPELARIDQENAQSAGPDMALVHRVLEAIRPEFDAPTWESFWQRTVEGRLAAEVAAALRSSERKVREANYRVLRRLRQELDEMR